LPLPTNLSVLVALERAKQSPAAYYTPLLASQDPLVRTGAWCALLDKEDVPVNRLQDLATLAVAPGIRSRAFRFLLNSYEYDLASVVANTASQDDSAARRDVMLAELRNDVPAQVDGLRRLYEATGDMAVLQDLLRALETHAGWHEALPVATAMLLINPHDAMIGYSFLDLVSKAEEKDWLDAVIASFKAYGLHAQSVMLFSALSSQRKGDPKGALRLLEQLAAIRIPRPDFAAQLALRSREVAALAFEKLGDYRRALTAFVDMKKVTLGKTYDPAAFFQMNLDAGRLEVPPLPPDERTNVYVMTGFPRSGTTLLENILATHPAIETFEEIPTRTSLQFYLDRNLPALPPGADSTNLFAEARRRYYVEIDRRRHKSAASTLVDKMPLRSAEAVFLKKIFPDKRFIFSIRHPFDVVLSGLRQNFQNNIAMEHFRTFEAAVKLYDFTMEQWFSVHDMQDSDVCYLRYDDLVTDFDASVTRVLSFLGVGWDDKVREFAQAAAQRSARTPSYGKVRQGLSIGVQTAWRNYDFLFQSPAAKPLYKWAEFFGYPTR